MLVHSQMSNRTNLNTANQLIHQSQFIEIHSVYSQMTYRISNNLTTASGLIHHSQLIEI